jgi:hypothetical protein
MSGIAGVLFRQISSHKIGSSLINMLDGCRHLSFDCGSYASICQTEYALSHRFKK